MTPTHVLRRRLANVWFWLGQKYHYTRVHAIGTAIEARFEAWANRRKRTS